MRGLGHHHDSTHFKFIFQFLTKVHQVARTKSSGGYAQKLRRHYDPAFWQNLSDKEVVEKHEALAIQKYKMVRTVAGLTGAQKKALKTSKTRKKPSNVITIQKPKTGK